MGRKTRKALIVVGTVTLVLLVVCGFVWLNPIRTTLRLGKSWMLRRSVDREELDTYLLRCGERARSVAEADTGKGGVRQGEADLRVRLLTVAGKCCESAGDRTTASAVFDEALDLVDRLAADPEGPTRQAAAWLAGSIRREKDIWLESD